MLSLFKEICKNASLGLRNLQREGRNGRRLVLILAFDPKN
jgi:hypothetical protein